MHSTYKKYLESQKMAASSINRYQLDLVEFLDFCDTNHITPESTTHNQLITYIATLKKRPLAQRSIKQHLHAISHFFEWKNLNNPIRSLTFKVPHTRPLYHQLDRQQLDALYHHFNADHEEDKACLLLRDKVITGLLVFQGVDGGDLRRITTQDIQLRKGTIHLCGDKKANPRGLKLEPQQLFDLMDYLKAFEKEDADGLVFNVYSGLLKSICTRLRAIEPKLEDVRQIRASVITHWIRQHGLRQAQYLAGHKYISSTEHYLQNDITELKLSIDQAHPLS